MEAMKKLTVIGLKLSFSTLLNNFKKYLGSRFATDVEVLSEINRLSSSTRGIKHIPLFTKMEVSKTIILFRFQNR